MTRDCALITGGARRLGRALALALADAGYDIALHCNRSTDEARRTAAEIRRRGASCAVFPCNLEKPSSARALMARVKARFPGLRVLVNNAAVFEPAPFLETTPESLARHLALNLAAPFELTRQFALAATRGQVLQVLDAQITRKTSRSPAYLLSKKLLSSLTRLCALELAPRIRVNALAPGLLDLDPADAMLTRLVRATPLRTKVPAAQVARAAVFLLESPQLTGQVLFVDSGRHLQG